MKHKDLHRLKTEPLGERARDALLESIVSGAFPDGRLPSENRLAEQLGVSRATVREALHSLEEAGLVSRQHGVGTRVNDHVVRLASLNRLDAFFNLIREAGYEPAIARTDVRAGAASEDVARRMRRAAGTPLLLIDRLFLADGRPAVSVVEQVVSAEIVGSVEANEVPESIFAFAERFCRSSIDHAVVEIVPTIAGDELVERLGLAAGTPLLRMVETHYSSGGDPFIVSEVHTVDEFLRFAVVRKRGSRV